MTVHRYHPAGFENVLIDGCARCDEQAAQPFEQLPRDHLRELLHRVRQREHPRSTNERRAMNLIRDILWRAEVLASLSEGAGAEQHPPAPPTLVARQASPAPSGIYPDDGPLASRKAPPADEAVEAQRRRWRERQSHEAPWQPNDPVVS